MNGETSVNAAESAMPRSAAAPSRSHLPALEATNVTVRFGDRVVLDVPSLAVSAGEVMAIMGPNGAGKSTLLLCLALLRRPTSGEIRVGGEPIRWGNDLLPTRRRMAVVFQEPLLLDTTVQENVALGLRLRGRKEAEAKESVRFWLERFGIEHLAKRQARTLSGGEAQRTSLARALVLAPETLLLDEPFAALDPPTRASLISDMKEVLRETGTTTLMITHDRDEALALGDRVGVLVAGQLRQVGTPDEVFASPVDAEVAAFVGIETVAGGIVINQEEGVAQVEVGGQIVESVSPIRAGNRVLVCLRPEDATLLKASDREQMTSARNCLRGTVSRVIPLGAQARVVVDCGFPLVALVTRRSAVEMNMAVGQTVRVSFKASAVHLIGH
ncbi:MAG: ABC transporter ATP-binding protein [Chloroflexi bacterium]|nr:ABC transporter ATP-binding protein [Chloroflexota bacterium]